MSNLFFIFLSIYCGAALLICIIGFLSDIFRANDYFVCFSAKVGKTAVTTMTVVMCVWYSSAQFPHITSYFFTSLFPQATLLLTDLAFIVTASFSLFALLFYFLQIRLVYHMCKALERFAEKNKEGITKESFFEYTNNMRKNTQRLLDTEYMNMYNEKEVQIAYKLRIFER